MFLKLGFVETVVVSSAEAAELFLKTHDAAFANRPKILVSHYLSYCSKGMVFDDYGPYWRDVRKVCALQLLSSSKIESFAPLRKEELGIMVARIKQAAELKQVVDVSARVGDFSLNLICRMIFGQRCNDDEFNFRPLIKEALELVGAINFADYVPYIAAFDLQGLTRRMKAYRKGMDKVLEKIIDTHEKDGRWKKKEEKDFIDVLLAVMNRTSPIISNDEQSYVIDRTCIKAIVQDIIIGGIETSSSSLEWTFSELLRHPRAMKCLQKELETVVGLDRIVEEKDLPNLTYLNMVIKDLRLYPTLPLIPRKCVEDIEVNGYHIPSNSRVLVNAWAIGRDPRVWSDNALEFYPERFKDECVDLRGHHFKLIPFGSGRRSCPGMSLGLRNVRLVVAQLAHCFNWELPAGMLPSDLDMTEKYGLTLPRANHFSAVPTYRLHV